MVGWGTGMGGLLILSKASIKVKNIGEGKDGEGWGSSEEKEEWGH